jgi:hypothetical protein
LSALANRRRRARFFEKYAAKTCINCRHALKCRAAFFGVLESSTISVDRLDDLETKIFHGKKSRS